MLFLRTRKNLLQRPNADAVDLQTEPSADCERLLERAMAQQGLSARAHDRILKVARTIADIDGIPQLEPKHIAEAIQYKNAGPD